jgi:muconolactone D-isomerase
LKAEEKARAQELQRSSKWRHLWHIAGQYANISVFDVADHDELHAILSSLPLFPFMEITVTPLARHPSGDRLNALESGAEECLTRASLQWRSPVQCRASATIRPCP